MPWLSQTRKKRSGGRAKPDVCCEGEEQKPDRAEPDLSEKGGISSVKRGKRRQAAGALFVLKSNLT